MLAGGFVADKARLEFLLSEVDRQNQLGISTDRIQSLAAVIHDYGKCKVNQPAFLDSSLQIGAYARTDNVGRWQMAKTELRYYHVGSEPIPNMNRLAMGMAYAEFIEKLTLVGIYPELIVNELVFTGTLPATLQVIENIINLSKSEFTTADYYEQYPRLNGERETNLMKTLNQLAEVPITGRNKQGLISIEQIQPQYKLDPLLLSHADKLKRNEIDLIKGRAIGVYQLRTSSDYTFYTEIERRTRNASAYAPVKMSFEEVKAIYASSKPEVNPDKLDKYAKRSLKRQGIVCRNGLCVFDKKVLVFDHRPGNGGSFLGKDEHQNTILHPQQQTLIKLCQKFGDQVLTYGALRSFWAQNSTSEADLDNLVRNTIYKQALVRPFKGKDRAKTVINITRDQMQILHSIYDSYFAMQERYADLIKSPEVIVDYMEQLIESPQLNSEAQEYRSRLAALMMRLLARSLDAEKNKPSKQKKVSI